MTDSYDDHTLQINTFNRPAYLFRTLKYIASDLPVGRVQVIDGSTEPSRSQNVEVVAQFADLMDIEHVQLEAGMNAIKQFHAGIQRTRTTYLTRCDDDNFVTPSSVRKSIAFLRSNPDYAVCSGIVTYITKKDGRITAAIHDVAPMEQDDPLDRFAYYLANHWTADFATWRADARIHSCRALDMFFLDETMGEPLSIGVGALHGKFHVIPEFSVVFCNHDGHLGLNARSRQFGPSSPAFGENLTAVGDFLVEYCESLGIAAPQNPREYYLSCYFYYMAKWYFLFDSIGDKVREQGAERVSQQRLSDHDALAEGEILGSLLDLPAPAASWIRDLQQSEKSKTRTLDYSVFTVIDDDVLLRDIPDAPGNEDQAMALPSGRDLPEQYRPFLDKIGDRDWQSLLQSFATGSAGRVLGPDADDPDQDGLFRGAFLRALTALIKPLNGMPPCRPNHWGRHLDLCSMQSVQRDQFLRAITLYDVFDTPELPDEVSLKRAVANADSRQYRIAYPRPTAEAVPTTISFSTGALMRKDNITLIPIDLEPLLLQRFGPTRPAWLGISVAVVTGKVQFGLFHDGQIDTMVVRSDEDEPGELFLPIRRTRYDYLFIRDLSRGAPSNCRIEGVRLYTLTGEMPSASACA